MITNPYGYDPWACCGLKFRVVGFCDGRTYYRSGNRRDNHKIAQLYADYHNQCMRIIPCPDCCPDEPVETVVPRKANPE